MKMGVDLVFMTGTKGGMETYVREVYARIAELLPDVSFIGYASRQLAEVGAAWFPGDIVDTGIDGDDRVAWARATMIGVGRRARRDGLDLLHAPANFGPAFGAPPTVVTVHDVIAHRHPEYVPGRYAPIVRAMVTVAARRASRILSPSCATADDVHSLLRIPRERIVVSPLAAAPAEPASHTRSDGRHVLTVGNRMPHKNVEVLLDALQLIPVGKRPRVVVTGGRDGDPLPSAVAARGLDDVVEIVGWLRDDELGALYRHASVVVLPTRFEGFGLPVLEAMERGIPVLCSDLPVLREVGGDAARYVDTTNAAELAKALMDLLEDRDQRVERSVAGRDRARLFSWERTATITAETLRAVADEGPSAEHGR